MKGLMEYFLFFVISIILLVLMIPTITGTSNLFVDRTVQTNARIISNDISNIINSMKSENTFLVNYELAKMNCEIDIKKEFVNVNISLSDTDKNFKQFFIQGNPEPEEKTILCDSNNKKTIKFELIENTIFITDM